MSVADIIDEYRKTYIVASIDVIIKMTLQTIRKQKPWVRSPTLQTVLMVDEFIKKHSSEYTKTEIFRKLPKKVMWGTFQIIIKYLEESYRIAIEKDGKITYIWNPELLEKVRTRREIQI